MNKIKHLVFPFFLLVSQLYASEKSNYAQEVEQAHSHGGTIDLTFDNRQNDRNAEIEFIELVVTTSAGTFTTFNDPTEDITITRGNNNHAVVLLLPKLHASSEDHYLGSDENTPTITGVTLTVTYKIGRSQQEFQVDDITVHGLKDQGDKTTLYPDLRVPTIEIPGRSF